MAYELLSKKYIEYLKNLVIFYCDYYYLMKGHYVPSYKEPQKSPLSYRTFKKCHDCFFIYIHFGEVFIPTVGLFWLFK